MANPFLDVLFCIGWLVMWREGTILDTTRRACASTRQTRKVTASKMDLTVLMPMDLMT